MQFRGANLGYSTWFYRGGANRQFGDFHKIVLKSGFRQLATLETGGFKGLGANRQIAAQRHGPCDGALLALAPPQPTITQTNNAYRVGRCPSQPRPIPLTQSAPNLSTQGPNSHPILTQFAVCKCNNALAAVSSSQVATNCPQNACHTVLKCDCLKVSFKVSISPMLAS